MGALVVTMNAAQHVREAPFSGEVRFVRKDGVPKIVMHIEHSTGATILMADPPAAKAFFESALAVATQACEAVIVATEMPKNGNRPH